MLKHIKVGRCDILLDNGCDETYFNFKDHVKHLENIHDVDPLGLRMLKEKHDKLNNTKSKEFKKLKESTVVKILTNWVEDLINEND